MNDQMQQELLKRLDALAAKLGIAANQLWAIFVRQAWNESLIQLIVGTIGTLLFGVLFGMSIKWAKDDDDLVPLVMVFFACLATVLIVGTLGLLGVMNPQYYAFKEIMSAIKP